jgi:pimeloyl-ACP methyl ester carboxylesterase
LLKAWIESRKNMKPVVQQRGARQYRPKECGAQKYGAKRCIASLIFLFLLAASAVAQQPPQGMYPVHFFDLTVEGQDLRMAYRDVAPTGAANGKTILLLHGKNFSGLYWEPVIETLTAKGYRAIAIDQLGFGMSSRPNLHYSFSQMAANTKALLDKLGVSPVIVIGHSMGGMLATRFALTYPQLVSKLVLESPIGLEDYRTLVPWASIEELYRTELHTTYEDMLKYQKAYYTVWKPEYEKYVQDQAWVLGTGEYPRDAMASALTYEMIYQQPVCYEFSRVTTPTLLIIGQADRTVVGKNRLPPELKNVAGNYPELGRKTHELIKNSQLVEMPNVGHIAHIAAPDEFYRALLPFLMQ